MPAKVEKCRNCDRSIGRMEQAFLWQDQIVCAECHARLSTPIVRPAAPPSPPAPPARQQDSQEAMEMRERLDIGRRETLADYVRQGTISAVEILPDQDACDVCKQWVGREIPLAEAIRNPPLPVPACTREYCRCSYAPIVSVPSGQSQSSAPPPAPIVPQLGLIECPACHAKVSPQARNCPHCGGPISNKPIVTERTAKSLKAAMLLFGLLACVGAVIAVKGHGFGEKDTMNAGLGILIIGLLGFILARIMAWWEHG